MYKLFRGKTMMIKKLVILSLLIAVNSGLFAQNIDHKNWKKLEEEMYQIAKRCYEVGNSREWLEKGAAEVEATSNDKKMNCKYGIDIKHGVVYYYEIGYSYSEETGFYADMRNIAGSPTVRTVGTDVYNTWNNIDSRWFFRAERVLGSGMTFIVLYFHEETLLRNAFK